MGTRVRLEDVEHEYGRTEEAAPVRALRSATIEIGAGDFAILRGPSGSGKSTVLNLIGAIERPSHGRLYLGDREISTLSEKELALIRRKEVGYVFQFFNLIPTLTVAENIGFPLALGGFSPRESRQKVAAILDDIGLSERASHYPNELSGGEMQRVAIGRAVIHQPPLILADEPTGNLDTRTGATILQLLRTVHERYRPTIVMATHSQTAAGYGDYVIDVVDGMVSRGAGAA